MKLFGFSKKEERKRRWIYDVNIWEHENREEVQIYSKTIKDQIIHDEGTYKCCEFYNCHFTYRALSEFVDCKFVNCVFDLHFQTVYFCKFEHVEHYKFNLYSYSDHTHANETYCIIFRCKFYGDCEFNGIVKFDEDYPRWLYANALERHMGLYDDMRIVDELEGVYSHDYRKHK